MCRRDIRPGESGVAALAALKVLCVDPHLRQQTGLDAQARVLMISTEGATATQVYRELVGESADGVRQRQVAWGATPV